MVRQGKIRPENEENEDDRDEEDVGEAAADMGDEADGARGEPKPKVPKTEKTEEDTGTSEKALIGIQSRHQSVSFRRFSTREDLKRLEW
eukprot:4154153-Amphidinium_carterae.1